MDQNTVAILIAAVAILVSLVTFFWVNQQRKKAAPDTSAFNTKPLQLQAYERLVMLAERIALPNLVSRANQPGMSAKEMQLLLLESIRQEYDYNATQQIYVSPVAGKLCTT